MCFLVIPNTFYEKFNTGIVKSKSKYIYFILNYLKSLVFVYFFSSFFLSNISKLLI